MKKSFFLMSFMLGLFVGVFALAACSNDDDVNDSVKKTPNAQGIIVTMSEEYSEIKGPDIYLWINNDVVKDYDTENKEKELNSTWFNKPYYPLTMSIVYEMIGEGFNVEGVNEDTDFSKFVPNPSMTISYIRSHKSQYKYVTTTVGGNFLLFNRISDVNY